MKKFCIRMMMASLLSVGVMFAQPVFAQNAGDTAAVKPDTSKAFPVPTVADGAELLRYEGVQFEADTSPMPDVASIVRSARKTKDASSMFITHMMYRDNIGDIAYYDVGKKQDTALSKGARHREMIRWREAASDATYELALLATSPSVQYEISPMFSNDDEFKKGLNWLKKAAAHGYGNAEYILGLVYFNGVGAKRDKKKGFELLVRAAAHGVVNAYYAVAMIYEMGLNGKKDIEKSLYWLEKAAHFGSKDAIFILAMKYADGIDVPQNEAKAEEIESLDQNYHAWTMLLANYYGEVSHRYCTEKYDESDIGRSNYTGGCESHVDYYDRFGSYDNDYDEDEAKKESPDDVASYSLEYKIDYRLAALWLKKVATFDRERAYFLRAQTHHLTGCHGGLDGDEFGNIEIFPEEHSWDDYNDYPLAYKKLVIALNDYDDKPAKLKKWLVSRVDNGDKDALLSLACLYDRSNYGMYKVNDSNGGDYKSGDEIEGADYNDDIVEKFGDLAKELGVYKDENRSTVKKNLQKAFEYYEKGDFYASAIRDAELLGSDLKNSNYDRIPKGQVTIDWFEKALGLSEKGYQHYIQAKDFANARNFAEKAANISRKLNKKADAMTWYSKALDANDKINNVIKEDKRYGQFRFNNSLRLVRLYEADSAGSDVKNSNDGKKVELYKNILQSINSLYYSHREDEFWMQDLGKSFAGSLQELLEVSMRLGDISYGIKSGDKNAKKSPGMPLAIEAYQRFSELANLVSPEDKEIKISKEKIALAHKLIQELPKMDLQKEVEKQILAERGKNADKFFIFDKILNQCEADACKEDWYDEDGLIYCASYYDEDGEGGCEYRTCRLKDFYQESIDKVITALTALSLANGALNLDEIKNTFYYLAIYKNWERLDISCEESSAVCQKIGWFLVMLRLRKDGRECANYSFNDYDQNKIYHIWYLRQIPYAAADKFKKLKSDKTWDEYLNEAKEIVKQNEQLRKAFGYDPALPVQRFAAPDAASK